MASLECKNAFSGWGGAPDPAGGAYSAPLDPLATTPQVPHLFGPRALALRPSPLTRNRKFCPSQRDGLDPPMHQPIGMSAAIGVLNTESH